ncbi:MAG: HNH endonuclease [Acidimicrobiia bacterium]
MARRMVDEQSEAQWRVTVINPETGEPAWTGITRRRPTAAQRRLISAYNPTCVFMGCRSPATRSDLDHNQPWAKGGTTTTDNLAPLCPRHHTAKDQGGWTLQQTRPGTYQWQSPLGHNYVVTSRPP